MIKNLAHVCFVVSDLDASIAFYEKLGLKQTFDFVRDTGERHGVYLHISGRNFLELFVGKLDPPAERQRYKHVCFEVDDMDATVASLRSQGITASDPKLGSDKSIQSWLKDPDGNQIELHQYTPQSKQAPWVK